jgi:NADPH-dependent curcumin reductase CurA
MGRHRCAAGRLALGFRLYAVRFDAQRFTGISSMCDAVERLLSGRSMGKVVVDISAAPSPSPSRTRVGPTTP